MFPAEFNVLLSEMLKRTENTLLAKGEEYAPGMDRLVNFKQAAAMQGCSPEQALVGMMCKHWVSVLDLVQRESVGRVVPVGMWEEKLGDARNYLFLLEALVKEREQ